MSQNDLSPLPDDRNIPDEIQIRLRDQRKSATDAILQAEEMDRRARAARKRAKHLVRMYERSVQEYNGQLQLPLNGEGNVSDEC